MTATTELMLRLKTLGLTQTDIARRTGIPQPRLSRWAREAPVGADDALKLRDLADQVAGQSGVDPDGAAAQSREAA